MRAADTWVRALDRTKRAEQLVLHELLARSCESHYDRPALADSGQALTYGELGQQINRYARWALEAGMAGRTVGLLGRNCADYVATWLGLTRVGCKVALLNTNLRGDSLAHSLAAAQATDLILDARFADSVDRLPGAIRIRDWQTMFGQQEPIGDPLPDRPFPQPADTALYVYTSGTTGLPKATRISHRRIVEWSCWFAGLMDATPADRIYNCLPMYHSTGGVAAVGSMLVSGGSAFIRERFSASQFWNDIVTQGCTIFQYIGELCRYLLAAAPHADEQRHRLRLACGNGLRREVWESFQARFGISRVLEFYAATEGALSLYNVEGKPGSIGRIPPFLARHLMVALIRCDQETLDPERDREGFCVRADAGEVGEAVSLLRDDRQFEGYTDADASNGKILRNVFSSGDRWFRSGDLMRRDSAGYFYFVDRLGDTFRWKGENVSTTEVAAILRGCPSVTDAVVFGVAVANNEGRAGMAAITTTADFALEHFVDHCRAHLPDYARPMFVRLCTSLDQTGTFKPSTGLLAREGYARSPDPVWHIDQKSGAVAPLPCLQH